MNKRRERARDIYVYIHVYVFISIYTHIYTHVDIYPFAGPWCWSRSVATAGPLPLPVMRCARTEALWGGCRFHRFKGVYVCIMYIDAYSYLHMCDVRISIVYLCMYIRIDPHICAYTYVFAFTYVHMRICVYTYTYMYVCTCVYMYIDVYIHVLEETCFALHGGLIYHSRRFLMQVKFLNYVPFLEQPIRRIISRCYFKDAPL